MLVAPVLQPGRTFRRLYLPSTQGDDSWTGQVHSGPGWVTIAAPLRHVPLFLRDGAPLDLPAPQDLGLDDGAPPVARGDSANWR